MVSPQVCPVGSLAKVLLATDRTQFSEGAEREAINFAKICSSRLYVITILETNPEYETIGSSVFEKEEAEAVKYLDSLKEKASHEGLICETIFHSGVEPSRAIVDEASEHMFSMIVIGKHGRTGLARLLMGEVAAKVIAHAPCKVLVVPKAARIEYRTILVASDGSSHSEAAASEAIAIAKRCGSRVIALCAMRDSSELQEATSNVNKVVELAKKEGVEVEAVTPVGRSYDAIVETAGGRGVDLIVMGTYGKTGVRKLLMGSSTEKVIVNAACAVLVVKS